MSTPRRIDPKTAAKRRAARRKRTRETLGRIGVLTIVAILVISTVATVFVPGTVTAPTPPTPTIQAAAPTVTQPGAGMNALVEEADRLATDGKWNDAASLYRAYLSGNQQDGEAHYKLGKVYLSMQPPNYIEGLAELQQALNINPNAPYAQDAQALIDRYEDIALTPGIITGTATTLLGTVTSTTTITAPGTVTGTAVMTGTVPATTSPAGATQTP